MFATASIVFWSFVSLFDVLSFQHQANPNNASENPIINPLEPLVINQTIIHSIGLILYVIATSTESSRQTRTQSINQTIKQSINMLYDVISMSLIGSVIVFCLNPSINQLNIMQTSWSVWLSMWLVGVSNAVWIHYLSNNQSINQSNNQRSVNPYIPSFFCWMSCYFLALDHDQKWQRTPLPLLAGVQIGGLICLIGCLIVWLFRMKRGRTAD